MRLSAIGDVVHTMPLACALRRARPDVELTWIVQPESAPLLEGHPAVTDVEVFPRRGIWRERWRALARLRRRRVDLLIDPQGNAKSALVSRAVRARRRLGVRLRDATEWPNRLGHGSCTNGYDPAAHVVDRYLGFAATLGIEDRRVDFGLAPRDDERARAMRRLEEAGLGGPTPVLLLQVCSREDVRQWSAGRMAEVADVLAGHGYGAVVVTGPRHLADGAEVFRRIRRATVLDQCGTLDLRGLLALMAVLADRPGSVLVSGDTAPVHVAVAVGLRVVGLYGSQPAWRNGPYGGEADVVHRQAELDCAPCRERTCRLHGEPRACMERIPVREVVERVLSPR